jgi:hypothetical protein
MCRHGTEYFSSPEHQAYGNGAKKAGDNGTYDPPKQQTES